MSCLVPVLIIWEMHDIGIRPQLVQARWLRYFAEAKAHLLDSTSHFQQEDEPETNCRLPLLMTSVRSGSQTGAAPLHLLFETFQRLENILTVTRRIDSAKHPSDFPRLINNECRALDSP